MSLRVVFQHNLTAEVRVYEYRPDAWHPDSASAALHFAIPRVNTRPAARGWVVVLDAAGRVLEGWPRDRWQLYYDPRDVPAKAATR